MTNFTEKIHRVRPKRFMSLWYVRCKPCIYLASRLVLSPNRPKWASTWASSPRSTIEHVQNDFRAYGTFDANRATISHQDWHCLQRDQNEHPLEPRHLGVPSGAQTVHLSCTNTNTISKWIETRFQMTNVTEKIHRVRPKWFLSLWYVRRKLCTYLASRLALCLNRPKWASTWATSPRSTIGCIQNDFCAFGTFGANRAPILH
jgi:hypothetical protein